jgi:glycosyltransferase involved in cell wall biosynthesis
VLDFIVGHGMRQCDVYIALGTVYLDSFTQAKKRFGSKTILEWGSKHVREQQRILASIHAQLNEEYFNLRSCKAYDIVDYISIPSEHVVRSFLKYGYAREKLWKNPYGVDVSMFRPLQNETKTYDVVMVGAWCKRKGCDLIVDALKHVDLSFLHVGSLGDVPFPTLPNFTHIDAVEQSQLVHYYNKAKVFVLPSREEGLAMVQVQAIACNLPVIGSRDSGAEDLKAMVADSSYVTMVEAHTPEDVRHAIQEALNHYKTLQGVYAGSAIANLTWEAYGRRYAENIQTAFANG